MPKHTPARLAGIALALSCLTAQAALLEQRGKPEGPPATMTTYGMEVSTRLGLKTAIPVGWQLFIHQSVQLPQTMSWKMGDSWTGVLAQLAATSQASVLIDWNQRQVLIRSEETARDESETRAEIAQAATTPLPRFGVERTPPTTTPLKAPAASAGGSPVAPRVAARDGAQDVSNVPVIRVNPTPAMVEDQKRAALVNPPKLQTTPEFAYTAATAWNKPAARNIAQAIANRYNLRLSWSAPEVPLLGPVTLLANSPEEDVALLQRAMGLFSPVTVEFSRTDKRIRALPRGAKLLDASPEVRDDVAPAAPAFTPAPAAFTAEQAPAAKAAAAVTLNLAAKQSLEDAIFKLTRKMGYTLEWKVDGGFSANRDMTFSGESLAQVLTDVLPRLGLSADIYSRERHVVVRGAAQGASAR